MDQAAPRVEPQVGRSLMPWPREVAWHNPVAVPAGSPIQVCYDGPVSPRLGAAVAGWLAHWYRTSATATAAARPAATKPIEFRVVCDSACDPYPRLGDDEAYALHIGDAGVRLQAAADWGLLRGLATLTQLVSPAGLPGVRMADAPRFPWRGISLDVARHFIPVARLIATLDAMALYKLNVLHLHLSDDQAFRFPSAAFPRLASAEAYRVDELELLISHAAGLGIRIVPELDVPGHTTSWLVAYPEWGSEGVSPSRRFGVHKACLDPTRPAVLAAIETLLGEVAELFPDKYLHFGGDEVDPTWWNRSPAINAYRREQGLGSAVDLQADFNRRIALLAERLQRRAIGWDEVLHPALPEPVVVQSWRGATARDRALEAGHDCVVSGNYYLDLLYPADVYYGFDPLGSVADLLNREDALESDPRLSHVAAGMRWTRHWREAPAVTSATPGRVLGAEACLWAEIVDAAGLDVRLWSRMPALAERFWSPAEFNEVEDMRRRLAGSLEVLARTGMDLHRQSRERVMAAGVEPPWFPLIEQLEPVKWYARLLGPEALAARLAGNLMPIARPYDADTPLDRVVDALFPEAPGALELGRVCAAERMGDQVAGAALRNLAGSWSALPATGAGPAELAPLAERLVELGQLVLAVLDGQVTRSAAIAWLASGRRPGSVAPMAQPFGDPVGEYLLAAVPVLLTWLQDDRR